MENVIPQSVAQPVTTPAPVVPSTTVPIVPATVVKVAVPEPAKAPEPTKAPEPVKILHPMPTCSCWLKMDKTGSNVQLHNVTPAEMLFLVAEHHINAGGQPIHDITQNEVLVDRDDQVEFDRLRMKYHPDKIRTLYPGPMPKLPSTFKQAMDLGVGIKLASKNLMDFSVR